jgi:Na+/melibiose symporter-like transporter
VARRRDKLPSLLLGVAGFSICVLGPPIAALAGLFPARESAAYIPLLAGAAFAAAVAATAGLVMGGSMLADVADEHELATGRRSEGILFAALSFAVKSTSGAGSLLAGVGLDWIAFPAQAEPHEVSAESVRALGLFYAPGVGLMALVSFALLRGYRIDRARHAEIAAALAQRRGAVTAARAEPA